MDGNDQRTHVATGVWTKRGLDVPKPLAGVVIAVIGVTAIRVASPPETVIPLDINIIGTPGTVVAEGRPECFEFVTHDGTHTAGVRGVRFRNVSNEAVGVSAHFEVSSPGGSYGDEGSGMLEPGQAGLGKWYAYDMETLRRSMAEDGPAVWRPAPVSDISRCTLELRLAAIQPR